MKAAASVTAALITVLSAVSPALAAAGVRTDHSGIVVWAFLGFCAMIVVVQLVPAILMMFGLVKGVAESTRETATEKAR